MLFALHVSTPADPFGGYPPWLVVAVLTVALAIAIWIMAKLLKWALWLLLIAVVVVGFAAAVWLLLN